MTLFKHPRQQLFETVEDCFQISVHDRIEFFFSKIDSSFMNTHPGVVDKNIDPAKPFEGGVDNLLHACRFSNIGHYRRYIFTAKTQGAGNIGQALTVTAAQDQTGTLGGEQSGDPGPYSPRRPGGRSPGFDRPRRSQRRS